MTTCWIWIDFAGETTSLSMRLSTTQSVPSILPPSAASIDPSRLANRMVFREFHTKENSIRPITTSSRIGRMSANSTSACPRSERLNLTTRKLTGQPCVATAPFGGHQENIWYLFRADRVRPSGGWGADPLAVSHASHSRPHVRRGRSLSDATAARQRGERVPRHLAADGQLRCSERRLEQHEVQDHEQTARPGYGEYPRVEAREQPLHLRVVPRIGDPIDGATAVEVHHDADEDEDDERRPDPCGAPERPHEPERDPGCKGQSEEDPTQRAGSLRYLEQFADPEVVPLLLEMECDGHRMHEQEPEHARDMDERDPLIHQHLLSVRSVIPRASIVGPQDDRMSTP